MSKFADPLVLILVAAAIISAFVQEWIDAAVVLVVVASSALLSFIQEYTAGNAVERLRARITVKATVLREGVPTPIPIVDVVPGDIVLLSAGSLAPADGLVLEAKDLFVDQAVLTGETFPVEKFSGIVAEQATLAARTNCVFMGTTVRSGTAHVLVVQTGAATLYGQIADRLRLRPPETEFERGIHRFSYLLTRIMLVLVLIVFATNVFAHRPPIDSLLFAMALAVGLTPELLPTIITICLSRGAHHMASHGVIVRRLNAIENLGSMNVLCTDKTGTLTEGRVQLYAALDVNGAISIDLLRDAYLNASLQTGLVNLLDEAVIAQARNSNLDTSGYVKVDEIPYDFVRRRLSVVVRSADEGPAPDQPRLITKGALERVLEVCDRYGEGAQVVPLDDAQREQIRLRYAEWSGQGLRVLGVASKPIDIRGSALEEEPGDYSQADERDLIFSGYLLFVDPPKADAQKTIADLADLGVQVKIITGDNRLVAAHLAQSVGIDASAILTGADLDSLRDEALWQRAERTTLFADIDPNQKERVILALRKMGHVVGFMGDGINDAPALHAADVGISVDQAVDVAKEAADFVLLEQSLDVLREGIVEGRKTFANTLKYIYTTTSANFGNMFSMAGASFFLPFLPLLAKQILLNNFLSDIPGMTIANDRVDDEWVQTPHRWDVRSIRNFIIVFGLVSSIFDYLTFGLLLLVIRAAPDEFRTAWFIESLMTELAVALVVRTRLPFYRSKPGTLLWLSTLGVAIVTVAIPYLPYTGILGFVPLPAPIMATLMGITVLYVVAVEVAKRIFYGHSFGVQGRPATHVQA